jgi:hypothetical protein
MYKITSFLVAFLCLSSQLFAQSWSKIYGNNYTSIGNAAVSTADGGFVLTGYGEAIGGGKSQMQLIKIDVNGKEEWNRGFGGQDVELGFDIANTPDNGFVVAGSSYIDASLLRQAYIVKTNQQGDEIWSRTIGQSGINEIIYSIIPTSNDGFLAAGTTQNPIQNNTDAILYHLDEIGNVSWSVPFGGAGTQEFRKVVEVADGYICVGSSVVGKSNTGQDNRDALLVKISKSGQILWTKTYGSMAYEDASSIVRLADGGFIFCGKDTSDILIIRTDATGNVIWNKKYGGDNEDDALSLIQTRDGNIVLAGNSATNSSNIDGFATKISLDGIIQWTRRVGSSQRYEAFNHVVEAKDGSLLFTGVWGSSVFLITSKMYAVKTEAEGILGNNYVNGKVFYDKNNNCKYDKDDVALNDWLVNITKPTRGYLSLSNGQGDFFTTVDSGKYNVTLLPQNSYWKQVCQTAYNISLQEQEDTITIEFALRPEVNCPSLEVNISTPQLLRCQPNRYLVNFCNRGTLAANNAYIDVTFDEYFDNFQVNLGNWTQNGNTIRCNLGNIPIGACGQFEIVATLDRDCNSTVEGQAHQVVAHIFPDEICTSPNSNWDGSSLKVSGSCINDKVEFRVKNVGTQNQLEPRKGFVIEDDVIYRVIPIGPLDVNEEILIDTLPQSGKTYRLIVEQSIGHPGNSNPTVAIEGCGSGTFSTGYVTQFSEDDGDPFVSISTQESRGKNNANEKIAFPKGVKAQRYISDSTELEYQIFYQNTSGDTLRSLTIIDTLSQSLNPLSIRELQCSHRFSLSFPRTDVLQFTLNELKLPDSSANALASSGYVKFRVSQKPNNPNGTLIHNRAALFYGNKAATFSTRTTHTIGKNYLIATVNPTFANVKLNVFPNPFVDVTNIEMSGLKETYQEKQMTLVDALGRVVRKQQFTETSLRLERGALHNGVYAFFITSNGKILGSGKLILQY